MKSMKKIIQDVNPSLLFFYKFLARSRTEIPLELVRCDAGNDTYNFNYPDKDSIILNEIHYGWCVKDKTKLFV